jgi:SAM-dependent methyltransferase
MKQKPNHYVHGHSDRELERLDYQAPKFADLFHHDTRYSPESRVLEVGCGVGAQTVILAQNNPRAEFISFDLSTESLVKAQNSVFQKGLFNVAFCKADVNDLPFKPDTFDHVFVCFLLEHLPDPLLALNNIRNILRPGGTITIIEGDAGSVLFYPESSDAHRVIDCFVELQQQMGGNPFMGRELWHLLTDAGFSDVTISPRLVYSDLSHQGHVEEVKNIFIAMIDGVGESAITKGLVDNKTWNKGIRDLHRITEQGGMICSTFFKGVGKKGSKDSP